MANLLESLLGNILKPILTASSKKRMAQHEGEIKLEGLHGKVEIRRDREGVPYIFAESQEDVFFAQGFVHAQDRLWQMEVNRRLATGRLSEVFGEAALRTDRLCRAFGFARMAKQDIELIDKEMRRMLDAYLRGVNACIEHLGKKLPVEFRLTKFKPEPWEPLQVLAWTRLMTLQLSNGWGHELARAHIVEALGPELAAELDIRHDERNSPTLPNGIEFNAFDSDGKLGARNGPFFKEIGGSNAWALSGNRTDTGKPYLCSDPHLAAMLPGIWYQIYLEAPGYRVQGVSIPGMPLVMIGHNNRISWGITLAFSDIQDLFVEEVRANGEEYLYKGEWKKSEVYPEKIVVKGQAEPHIERICVTHNGPLLTEFLDTGGKALSLNSPALRPSRLTMGWYHLDKANGWDEFVEAMRFIDAPGLNIVYADVEGNIGYWMTGKTPIRGKGFGEQPSISWTGEFDFKGFVPFEQMPHTLNPQRGYVISANNKVVDSDFPYFMGNVWMNGYRARRIEELLLEKPKWRRDDFAAIHMDVFCRPGLEFATHYKDVTGDFDSLEQAALQAMLDWDGFLHIDAVGGTIYQVTRREFTRLLFEKAAGKSGEGKEEWLLGKGVDPVLFKVNEFQGKETVAILQLLNRGESKLLDLAGGKNAALANALKRAVSYLKTNFGADLSAWQWGRLHQVDFPHSMAIKKPLDKVFNAGLQPIPGDTDTVYQTSIQPSEPYNANLATPSYRQIIDLADFNRSLWIKPPGQSGQLGAENYTDQLRPWLEGKYFSMPWDRKNIVEQAKKILVLGKV